MHIFFDNEMIGIENDKNTMILYSPKFNRVCKIHKNAMKIIEAIKELKLGVSYNICELAQRCSCSELDIEEFMKNMYAAKMFFDNVDDYQKYDISQIALQSKQKIGLKVAYIHITQSCNLDCKYCYNKKNLNKSRVELTTEQWYDVIDKLRNVGVTEFVFTGGEPLLKRDVVKIIEYAKKFGQTTLLTNGTLLNQFGKELYENVDYVILSMDSIDERVNKANRLHVERYPLFNNVKNIPAEYRDKFTIRAVITKDNKDKIERTRQVIQNELNIKFVTTSFLPNNANEVKLMPQIENELLQETVTQGGTKKIVTCGGCTNEIAIDSNGDIYPCQNLICPEFYICNIMSEDWNNLLETSQITKTFRNITVNDLDKCRDCVFRYICGGGCRAIAYKVKGELTATNDFMCDFLKQETISRLKSMVNKK